MTEIERQMVMARRIMADLHGVLSDPRMDDSYVMPKLSQEELGMWARSDIPIRVWDGS